MKNEFPTVHLSRIALAFMLSVLLPSHVSADLLGDLNQAVDLMKKVGDILPGDETTSAPQASKQNADPVSERDVSLILNRPEHYYKRPQHFDSLGFELGEYIVISPLDKTTFNKLYIPSYKGLPRLALTPHYLQVKKDINIKNAVTNRFKNDMLIYHNLRLLDLMAKHVTAENLKVDTSNKATFKRKFHKQLYSVRDKTQTTDNYFYQYTPRYHIESLATTLLPKVHERYFCDPEEPCTSDIFLRSLFAWGGYNKNNEFKSRRAYFNFIETEVPKLKAWAKSLNHEAYIVGTVMLGEYDFDRQGFELALMPPRGVERQFFYAPRDPSKRIFVEPNGEGNRIFFAINEAKAEALQSQTKTTPNQQYSQLYFVVKGEVYNAASSATGNISRHWHSQTYALINSAYDVTGTSIEFYSDELLTNKVFETNINP